jgi:hypothetical protein
MTAADLSGLAPLEGETNPGAASDRIIVQCLGFAAVLFALRFVFRLIAAVAGAAEDEVGYGLPRLV